MASSARYFTGPNFRSFSDQNDFEFTEFDIYNIDSPTDCHKSVKKTSPVARDIRRAVRKASSSVPVDVPNWSMILKKELNETRTVFGDDDVDDDVACDWIPPHEYLAKVRIASCSVHEGIGRTLKGRDLSRVRNAVWEQIGFED